MRALAFGLTLAFVMTGCSFATKVTTKVATFAGDDLDAAIALAIDGNDPEGATCAATLKKYLGPDGTLTMTPPEIKGAFSAFEAARLGIRQQKDGLPDDLKRACAVVLMDTRMFLLKLGLIAGGASVGLPPGLIP